MSCRIEKKTIELLHKNELLSLVFKFSDEEIRRTFRIKKNGEIKLYLMKVSNIILIGALIILAVVLYHFVKNENREVYRSYNISTGKHETYDPETKESGSGLIKMSEDRMNDLKSKQRKKLLVITGVLGTLIIVVFVLAKQKENRIDPIKNLDNLKEKNIISQDEYNDKIVESQRLKKLKKEEAIKEKEKKKLIEELKNLKTNGLLSEQEFSEKLEKIEKGSD